MTDVVEEEVTAILSQKFSERDGRIVPSTDAVGLRNDAVKLSGTVLYADLADSTNLVNRYVPEFVAKVYKCYLNASCRLIRDQGGEITAFDGDRVMAVFLGETPNTDAVSAALAISHSVIKIITPALRKYYKLPEDFWLRQAVGIDMSSLFVARTGIRDANDLVWVGRSANYAAKLSALRKERYSTWITEAVYDRMNDSAKYSTKVSSGAHMWTKHTWNAHGQTIFGSSWYRPL